MPMHRMRKITEKTEDSITIIQKLKKLKKPGETEHDMNAKVVCALNRIPGVKCYKTLGSSYGVIGQPDITGCYRGMPFFIEGKGARWEKYGWKMVKEKQRYELVKWYEAGAFIGIYFGVRQAIEMLEVAYEVWLRTTCTGDFTGWLLFVRSTIAPDALEKFSNRGNNGKGDIQEDTGEDAVCPRCEG